MCDYGINHLGVFTKPEIGWTITTTTYTGTVEVATDGDYWYYGIHSKLMAHSMECFGFLPSKSRTRYATCEAATMAGMEEIRQHFRSPNKTHLCFDKDQKQTFKSIAEMMLKQMLKKNQLEIF